MVFGPNPETSLNLSSRDELFSIDTACFLISDGITPEKLFKSTKMDKNGYFFIGYDGIDERVICNPIQWADIMHELYKHYHPEWFAPTPVIKLENS